MISNRELFHAIPSNLRFNFRSRFDNNVDQTPPRPQPSPMAKELVLCYCSRCNRHSCTTSNAWTKIRTSNAWTESRGGLYTSDDLKLFANPGLIVTGQRVPAQADLDGCVFQNLACAGCGELIGWICVETNEEKKDYR